MPAVRIKPWVQMFVCPWRQGVQFSAQWAGGPQRMRSPTVKPSTPSPSAATVPTFSCPNTIPGGIIPARRKDSTSVPQIPQYSILTSI